MVVYAICQRVIDNSPSVSLFFHSSLLSQSSPPLGMCFLFCRKQTQSPISKPETMTDSLPSVGWISRVRFRADPKLTQRRHVGQTDGNLKSMNLWRGIGGNDKHKPLDNTMRMPGLILTVHQHFEWSGSTQVRLMSWQPTQRIWIFHNGIREQRQSGSSNYATKGLWLRLIYNDGTCCHSRFPSVTRMKPLQHWHHSVTKAPCLSH